MSRGGSSGHGLPLGRLRGELSGSGGEFARPHTARVLEAVATSPLRTSATGKRNACGSPASAMRLVADPRRRQSSASVSGALRRMEERQRG